MKPRQESPRPLYTFDGWGINGPDIYRTRLATFTNTTKAAEHGPFFERALNAHDPMMHALREAGTMLDHVLNGQTVPDSDDISAALFTVREAIRAGELK